MRRIFHRLVSIDEVEPIISKYVKLGPLGVESISLEDALGRVLAEDLYAPIDYPPFDRSEFDGYAVRAEDTFGADEEKPVRLKVKDIIRVGEVPSISIGPGEAIEISTGSVVPRGANAVVPEEYTQREGNYILVYKPVTPGFGISSTSSDISMGDLVLRKGVVLGPSEISLIAALGLNTVKVYRRVRVGIFSTGNEIVRPGSKLELGRIYDSNTYFLISYLRRLGISASYLGHLPDDYEVMRKNIEKALQDYDVIMTTGGTSAGVDDLIYRVFNNLGSPGVIIHGLKVKPGKPTVVAVVNRKLLFGLPGFPLSCAMVFHKVVRPLIAKLAGLRITEEPIIKAKVPYKIKVGKGRDWLIPVSLVHDGTNYLAYPVTLSSGSVSAFVQADGYIHIESSREYVDEFEEVDVYLLKELRRLPKLVIIGSHDIALWRILEVSGLMDVSRVISVGSLRGWYAVARGEADIAPTHLLDEETGEYNVPYLSRLGLKDKAVLVRGYGRRIGFVIARGNPKKIRGFEDLLRDDVVLVNRVKGSGIRVLLDIELKELAKKLGFEFNELVSRIKGYTYEVKTHTAVAAAIAQGRADVGIAAEIAARMYGLDFIPLTTEIVDFLIRKDRLTKDAVKSFIEFLRSKECRELINSIPGYSVLKDTGEFLS